MFPSSTDDAPPSPVLVQACSATIGAINNGASLAVSIAVPGARAGMAVVVNPRPTLDDNILLVQEHVSADDTVQVIFYNLSAAPITPGAQTFEVALFANVPSISR